MQETAEIKDNILFQKIASGDKDAFKEIFELYSPVIYPLIKKIVTEEKTAEYILSEVFRIIWVKAPVLKIKNVYAWIVTLARNRAVDSLRRSNSDSETIDFYDEEYEDFFILPALSALIMPFGIESAFVKADLIKKSLEELTEAQKYVIHLALYEGLTLIEISKKLQIQVETVRTKILIALQILKEKINAPEAANG